MSLVFRMGAAVVIAMAATTPISGSLLSPKAQAALYYTRRYDYRQAHQLWMEVLKESPKSVDAITSLAELKLLLDSRAAARDSLLQFLSENAKTLSNDEKRAVREKLGRLQGLFLTNDGQAAYYQALSRMGRGDYAGALGLLVHADNLEKGNVEVMKSRAVCERTTEAWESYYSTLRSAHANNPFDPQIVEQLAEAHLYFRQPDRAAAIFRDLDPPKTLRSRTALAVALAETGNVQQAMQWLPTLTEGRLGAVHPFVYFSMGKILAQRPGSAGEARVHLEKYLSSSTGNRCQIEKWDPYRCSERRDEAEKLVAALKSQGVTQ